MKGDNVLGHYEWKRYREEAVKQGIPIGMEREQYEEQIRKQTDAAQFLLDENKALGEKLQELESMVPTYEEMKRKNEKL